MLAAEATLNRCEALFSVAPIDRVDEAPAVFSDGIELLQRLAVAKLGEGDALRDDPTRYGATRAEALDLLLQAARLGDAVKADCVGTGAAQPPLLRERPLVAARLLLLARRTHVALRDLCAEGFPSPMDAGAALQHAQDAYQMERYVAAIVRDMRQRKGSVTDAMRRELSAVEEQCGVPQFTQSEMRIGILQGLVGQYERAVKSLRTAVSMTTSLAAQTGSAGSTEAQHLLPTVLFHLGVHMEKLAAETNAAHGKQEAVQVFERAYLLAHESFGKDHPLLQEIQRHRGTYLPPLRQAQMQKQRQGNHIMSGSTQNTFITSLRERIASLSLNSSLTNMLQRSVHSESFNQSLASQYANGFQRPAASRRGHRYLLQQNLQINDQPHSGRRPSPKKAYPTNERQHITLLHCHRLHDPSDALRLGGAAEIDVLFDRPDPKVEEENKKREEERKQRRLKRRQRSFLPEDWNATDDTPAKKETRKKKKEKEKEKKRKSGRDIMLESFNDAGVNESDILASIVPPRARGVSGGGGSSITSPDGPGGKKKKTKRKDSKTRDADPVESDDETISMRRERLRRSSIDLLCRSLTASGDGIIAVEEIKENKEREKERTKRRRPKAPRHHSDLGKDVSGEFVLDNEAFDATVAPGSARHFRPLVAAAQRDESGSGSGIGSGSGSGSGSASGSGIGIGIGIVSGSASGSASGDLRHLLAVAPSNRASADGRAGSGPFIFGNSTSNRSADAVAGAAAAVAKRRSQRRVKRVLSDDEAAASGSGVGSDKKDEKHVKKDKESYRRKSREEETEGDTEDDTEVKTEEETEEESDEGTHDETDEDTEEVEETVQECKARCETEVMNYFSAMYKRRTRAAHKIQCAWRCRRARSALHARQQLLYRYVHREQKAATLCIEGFLSGILDRRRLCARIAARDAAIHERLMREEKELCAARLIAHHVVAFLQRRREERALCKSLALRSVDELRVRKVAVVILQRWWRIVTKRRAYWLRRAAEIEEERARALLEVRRHCAAIALQRVVRGALARRYAALLRERRAESQRRRRAMLRECTDAVRHCLEEYAAQQRRAQWEEGERQREHDKGGGVGPIAQSAALVVQCGWRAALSRRALHDALSRCRAIGRAVLTLQRAVRRFRAGREVRVLRRVAAQECLGRLRDEAREFRAALTLQCFARVVLARRERRRLRAAFGRGLFLAALDIQRTARGAMVRLWLRRAAEVRRAAAEAIVKAAQQFRERTADVAAAFLRARHSAELTERRRCRRVAEKLFLRRHVREALRRDRAAECIQRAVWRWIARRRGRERAEREAAVRAAALRAVVMSQAGVRAMLARRELRRRKYFAQREMRRRMDMEEVMFAQFVDEWRAAMMQCDHDRRWIEETERRRRERIEAARDGCAVFDDTEEDSSDERELSLSTYRDDS